MRQTLVLSCLLAVSPLIAGENIPIWPGMAPGETSDSKGELLPPRGPKNQENPVERVKNVRLPTMDIFPACLLYTSPSPRDLSTSRMPSSA